MERLSVIDMEANQAKFFFLEGSNYCSIDLPKYFDFGALLKMSECKYFYDLSCKLDKDLIKQVKKCENVNYNYMSNKDGKYTWRQLQIIHPILYIDLVYEITKPDNWKIITERLKQFRNLCNIECYSIPFDSDNDKSSTANIIDNWLENIENRSIQLSLNYKYMAHADIENCYSSIYTHSISWAIHDKLYAKDHRFDPIIGNIIDERIQCMSYGQTNGIPQGSVLMDFIAEIVLGYADMLLSERLKDIYDYKIIRFRDDYRIFSNSKSDLEKILKILSEVLSELNMKFNTKKTFVCDDVISNSIKQDKLNSLFLIVEDKSILNWLLKIRQFSLKNPNSSFVKKMLVNFYEKKLKDLEEEPECLEQLISITTDLLIRNPKSYMACSGILSKLLSFCTDKIDYYIESIRNKFKEIPNTDDINMCLQRITLKFNRDKEYSTLLAKKVYGCKEELWNSSWLPFKIDESVLINETEIENIDSIIGTDEINFFFYE